LFNYDVIDITNTLKAKKLLNSFDLHLSRLIEQGSDVNEKEAETFDLLSEWLEQAIESGTHPQSLQERTSQLTQLAFDRGYSQHEVEELLTIRRSTN